MNEWLEAAPQATAVQGNVKAMDCSSHTRDALTLMEKLAGCEPTTLGRATDKELRTPAR
jgi:hypothetical protein